MRHGHREAPRASARALWSARGRQCGSRRRTDQLGAGGSASASDGLRGTSLGQALNRLQCEHNALLTALGELESSVAEPGGAATSAEQMRLALLALLRDDLSQAQHALALAVAGRYGLCEHCQRPISARTLERQPAATRCRLCAVVASGAAEHS